MNSKRILISLVLALVVSVLCTWLVSSKMTVPPAPTVQKLPDARYATPSRALRAGEILKSKDIELVAWPGNDPLDGAFSQPAEVIGREVLFPLAKGQPILDRDLSAAGAGTGLASKIPECAPSRCVPTRWSAPPDFWFPALISTYWLPTTRTARQSLLRRPFYRTLLSWPPDNNWNPTPRARQRTLQWSRCC